MSGVNFSSWTRLQSPDWDLSRPAHFSPIDENFLIDDRAALKIAEMLKLYNDRNTLIVFYI